MNNFSISRTASESYGSHRGTNLNATYSLGSFRETLKAKRNEFLADNKVMNTEITKIRETYSVAYANDRIKKLTAEHNTKLLNNQRELSNKLEAIIKAKQNALNDFVTKAPSSEQLALLQTMNLRAETLSKDEIGMAIRKCSDNYQALSSIQAMANKAGISFAMPFSVEEYQNNLNFADNFYKDIIKTIGDDSISYKTTMFYGDYKKTMVTNMIDMLDSDQAFSIEEKPIELTRLEKLNQAMEQAEADSNYKKAMKISEYVEENKDKIITDKERDAEIEELITR